MPVVSVRVRSCGRQVFTGPLLHDVLADAGPVPLGVTIDDTPFDGVCPQFVPRCVGTLA